MNVRVLVSQPKALMDAAERQYTKEGKTRSDWIGSLIFCALPKREQARLKPLVTNRRAPR